MKQIIEKYFEGLKACTVGNLAYLIEGIMRSGTANVWHAAQAMSPVNGQSFKTNEKRGNRLLQDENFQIDDTQLFVSILTYYLMQCASVIY